jgi:peptide/nickel transport system permease protein
MSRPGAVLLTPVVESAVEAPSRGRRWWIGGFGAAVGILVVVIAASAIGNAFDLLHPAVPHFENALQSPSVSDPFGTDAVGRNVFARTVSATLLDIQVGLITTSIPLVVGTLIGALLGYIGGMVDSVFMRVMDVLLAIPFLVLVLAIVAVIGPGLSGIYIGLSIAGIPVFARIARTEMSSLREQQFILAARTLGFGQARIIFRHALPHTVKPALVFSLASLVGNIAALAALSYLGLGVQPPTPEWGSIIAEGQTQLLNAWWISTLPGLFMVVVLGATYMVGEALAERLDVRVSGVA